jgi:hypothetical protein
MLKTRLPVVDLNNPPSPKKTAPRRIAATAADTAAVRSNSGGVTTE